MVVFAPAAARVSSQPSSLPLFVWVPYLCICHFYIQWNIFFRRVRKLVHYEKLWHWVVSSQRQQLGESVVANTCNLVEVDTLYSSSWMSAVFYYVRHLPPDCILNVHVNLQALFPWRRTLAIYYLVPLKLAPMMMAYVYKYRAHVHGYQTNMLLWFVIFILPFYLKSLELWSAPCACVHLLGLPVNRM